MRSIAEALGTTLRSLGLRRGVEQARAVAAWPTAAAAVVGTDAVRSRAVRIVGDTMVVAVSSPVLAQELRLRQQEVLAALARLAPEAHVRALRFVPR